jgi:signal transduction histidine kinase
MLVLTVMQGPDRGRRFELPDHEPQMIGRSSEALPLLDQTISRRHAELTPDNGQWYLRDLGSANGTFVNGVRITGRHALKNGDQLRAGTTLLVFGEQGPPRPPAPVRGVGKREVEVSLQHTASSDDSMIMSVPDPSSAAQFQLGVIYELVGVVGSAVRRDELLHKVMEVIFTYFEADRAFILLREDPNDPDSPLHAEAIRKRDPATGKAVQPQPAPPRPDDGSKPITYSRTIVQYVLRKEVGVLSANAMADQRFTSGDSVTAYGIRSVMCVPIRYKQFQYGVIHLDSQVANYTYTEDQLTLLTAMGVQTGLAIANLRLVEARLRAERLAAVGQTVASLSHSIKNILQGMRGGADVVELGLRKQNMKVVRGGWDIVARNLERIYELSMNMLAFSKQRRPETEVQNVQPILEELAALVQNQYDAKKVALVTDLSPDVPPVAIDGGGLHQAMLNLLNNALDAVEPEAGIVTLRAAYNESAQQVVLQVADNGEGMTPQTKSKLFTPFLSSKGYGGTGLGLVVTRKIVDDHHGTIDVESTRGEGATFTIRLPLRGEAHTAGDTHGPRG